MRINIKAVVVCVICLSFLSTQAIKLAKPIILRDRFQHWFDLEYGNIHNNYYRTLNLSSGDFITKFDGETLKYIMDDGKVLYEYNVASFIKTECAEKQETYFLITLDEDYSYIKKAEIRISSNGNALYILTTPDRTTGSIVQIYMHECEVIDSKQWNNTKQSNPYMIPLKPVPASE